jgi:D-alanine-D-alanine ligase
MKKINGHAPKNRKNGKHTSPSLGPVNNLEEYLQPDWWRRIFNSMYLKTDADVVEDKTITAFELDMFTGILGLSKEQKILDLACGQGRHALELARRGYMYVSGLDRSHYLINKAKQISQTEGLQANFKEGDARRLPYPTDNFDVVMILGNSFGYFETIDVYLMNT